MTRALSDLWPPFALRVECGPLVLRVLRDDDFPEVLEAIHGGVHPPGEMPFYVPWTDAEGADLEQAFLQYHWSVRAETAPEAWALELGVWHEGRFVGVQAVRTSDFAVTRTGETGSWLAMAHQGRGIGTLMRQALCVTCFDHLGFTEVTSGAFRDNPASLGVSRKVGYREDGERRLVRRGQAATNVRLVLTPEALVRPPYDVRVSGAETFLEMVQARAT